jgi:hypothetical protein
VWRILCPFVRGVKIFMHAYALVRALGGASLVAAPFYRAMGMEAVGQGVYTLPCGTPLPCVHMRKALIRPC